MSALKLLKDYCTENNLSYPTAYVRHGTYGGKIGIVDIDGKIYQDNQERKMKNEALDAAAIIALRDLLQLGNK